MSSFRDIVLNTIGGIIVTYIISLIASIWNRRAKFRFFGIKPTNKPQLVIYLSRLQIVPEGAKGVEPIHLGYYGPAININEYNAALEIKSLLSSRLFPFLPFWEWLEGKSAVLTDIQPDIRISPEEGKYHEILPTSMIVLGSSIYNLVSEHYLKQEDKSVYYFTKNANGKRVIKARKGRYKDYEELPCQDTKDLGFIQRIVDRGNTIYICAGIEVNATCSVVNYLVTHWKQIHRRIGNTEPFALCLSFPKQERNSGIIVEADDDPVDFMPSKMLWK